MCTMGRLLAEPLFDDRQRAAIAAAYVRWPPDDVARMAAAGQLRDEQGALTPFEIKPDTAAKIALRWGRSPRRLAERDVAVRVEPRRVRGDLARGPEPELGQPRAEPLEVRVAREASERLRKLMAPPPKPAPPRPVERGAVDYSSIIAQGITPAERARLGIPPPRWSRRVRGMPSNYGVVGS
jgi:hypothetical protein